MEAMLVHHGVIPLLQRPMIAPYSGRSNQTLPQPHDRMVNRLHEELQPDVIKEALPLVQPDSHGKSQALKTSQLITTSGMGQEQNLHSSLAIDEGTGHLSNSVIQKAPMISGGANQVSTSQVPAN